MLINASSMEKSNQKQIISKITKLALDELEKIKKNPS